MDPTGGQPISALLYHTNEAHVRRRQFFGASWQGHHYFFLARPVYACDRTSPSDNIEHKRKVPRFEIFCEEVVEQPAFTVSQYKYPSTSKMVKTVLITGGNRGLGLSLVTTFSQSPGD